MLNSLTASPATSFPPTSKTDPMNNSTYEVSYRLKDGSRHSVHIIAVSYADAIAQVESFRKVAKVTSIFPTNSADYNL